MSENHPKALALHLAGRDFWPQIAHKPARLLVEDVQIALDDLGLKLVAKDEWKALIGDRSPRRTLRGGPDPEGATASRHPGDN